MMGALPRGNCNEDRRAADIDQDENVTAPFTQSTVEAAALTGLILEVLITERRALEGLDWLCSDPANHCEQYRTGQEHDFHHRRPLL
jgi:hypothetical protein